MNKSSFLLGLFLLVLYFVWYLYKPFLMPITIASLLAIATSNLYLYFDKRYKPPMIKAIILTAILGLIFFAPIVYALNSLAYFVNNFDITIIEKIVQVKNKLILPEYLGFAKPYVKEFLANINVANLSTNIFKYATLILKGSANFVKDMIIILIFYFFVNLYAKPLIEYLKDVLPFEKKSLFFVEISSVMNIVFYSTLITAIFEGTLFAIIAMIYGYNGLLFGILYGFASLIPVVGGLLLWLPLSLYHYSTEDSFGAVMIASYSVLVISLIADTFIKPFIIEYVNEKAVTTPSNISSLVIFFAMLAGLTTFGFWGVIVGPAITTFFISFLKIYHKVLHEKS
jgi:predicted PurR-regulated permease PerM